MNKHTKAEKSNSARRRFLDEGDRIILRSFVGADAKGAYVSGAQLATELGVSRPAIWGRFKRLEGEGFAFEGVPNRGYRLVRWPRQLHTALLEEELRALGETQVHVFYLPEVDSTNSEAERQLTYGRCSPLAVFSSAQTAGRGRMGRSWASAADENVYLSFGLRPNLPSESLRGLTLWAGIFLARGLSPYVESKKIELKWPNDLRIDGKKFGGILTEAKSDTDGMRTLIIGLGLNVNGATENFPDEIRNKATTLGAHADRPLLINRIAARAAHCLHQAYQHTLAQPPEGKGGLASAWRAWDCLAGQSINIRRFDTQVRGVAVGVDDGGALLVDCGSDGIQAFQAGEVTTQGIT